MMATTLKQVKPAQLDKDIFFEGNLVQSTQTDGIYLVTVPCGWHSDIPDNGTFWGISLNGSFVSGGPYCKELFKQFVGTITLEGKY